MKRLDDHQQLLVMSALEDRIDWCRRRLQSLTQGRAALTPNDTDEILTELHQVEAIYDLLADAHTVTITSLTEALTNSSPASLAALAGHDEMTDKAARRQS